VGVATKQTAHASAAIARVVSQLREKPKFDAFVRAFAAEVQAIEDALFTVIDGYKIDESSPTAALDRLGEILGQARNGATNAVYVTYLRARVRVNRSLGRAEDVLNLFRVLLPTTAVSAFVVTDYYPSAFTVTLNNIVTTAANAAIYASFLAGARSAGVNAQLIFQEQLDTGTFSFSSQAGVAQTSSTTGLADAAQTTGGALAGVKQA
jgi:hypothetical protein